MHDITIKKVPSFNSAKSYVGYLPERLTDDKLITLWAKVTVILKHTYNGTLTDDYYNIGAAGSCVGRIPREAWLTHNLQYCKDEYWNEITKRGLQNSFTLWDETRKTA